MRLTNSERTKARGLGIESPGPCLSVNFCGPSVIRCRREARAPSEQHLPQLQKTRQKLQSPWQSVRPPVFFLELGRRATSELLRPVIVSHRKRGSTATNSLWTLAGFSSNWAKRSLNIPAPPHIQIYTVPERRRREMETRER